MSNRTWMLIDENRTLAECDEQVAGSGPTSRFTWKQLHGGKSQGVHLLSLDRGDLGLEFVPARGLAIRRLRCQGMEFGWESPIAGPVHPAFVPVFDPSGLGWLEGFDELVCRCGLASCGAPVFDARGVLQYPLHGRIANTPAHRCQLQIDDSGAVEITGEVDEARFLFYSLRLRSMLRMPANSRCIEIEDSVENLGGRTCETQMLYHINLGAPFLRSGCRFLASVHEVTPRDSVAEAGLADWQEYSAPVPGFAEQVYFVTLRERTDQRHSVMLRSPDGACGFGLRWQADTLPYFTLWKNTAAEADGYVTGLEPGTSLPNPRPIEQSLGRIITLAPGESISYRLELHPLMTSEETRAFEALL